jgi:hypothetical protein
MATFNKFQDFSEQVHEGVHNFASHTFRIALTNTAPVATNTILANITQISGTNGYTTGGTALSNVTCTESTGTTTVAADKVTFTASGGAMGTFQYAVLYNDSATSPADALIGWWDYGSAVNLASGESFEVKFSNQDTAGTIFTHS